VQPRRIGRGAVGRPIFESLPHPASTYHDAASSRTPTVVDEFGFSLDEINWLGNVVSCSFLLVAFLTPYLTHRVGIRKTVRARPPPNTCTR
jgi:hypothetical protein